MAIGDTQRHKLNVLPSDKNKRLFPKGHVILAKGQKSQRDNAIEFQLIPSWC